jgi:hypothetical protein
MRILDRDVGLSWCSSVLAFHILAVTIALEVATLPSVQTNVTSEESVHQIEVLRESKGIQDRFLPAALPMYMKRLLWCTDLCDHGPTEEDEHDAFTAFHSPSKLGVRRNRVALWQGACGGAASVKSLKKSNLVCHPLIHTVSFQCVCRNTIRLLLNVLLRVPGH